MVLTTHDVVAVADAELVLTVDELAALARLLEVPEVAGLERPGRIGEVSDEQFQYGVAAGIRSLLARQLVLPGNPDAVAVPTALAELVRVMSLPEMFVMCRRIAGDAIEALMFAVRDDVLVKRLSTPIGLHWISVHLSASLSDELLGFASLAERPRFGHGVQTSLTALDAAAAALRAGGAAAANAALVSGGMEPEAAAEYLTAVEGVETSTDIQVFRAGPAGLERSAYVGWMDCGEWGLWLLPAADVAQDRSSRIVHADPASLDEIVRLLMQAVGSSGIEQS